jgi:hypothetical protein
MTISRSTVKSLCTSSEVALVRASRKGEIEQLNYSEVKRLAVRARRLFDKWRGLGRGQSRARSRQVGFGDHDTNTRMKANIFREALDAFEARLAKLDASAAPAGRHSKPKTKRARSATHRSTRAAIRKGMTAVEDLLNTEDRKKPKQKANVASPPAPQPQAPAAVEPERAAAKARRAAETPPPKKRRVVVADVGLSRQHGATTAAKQARIARSGKTTRMRGHVAARGKRSQARRDAKG